MKRPEPRIESCACQTCGGAFDGMVMVYAGRAVYRPRECPACQAKCQEDERKAMEQDTQLKLMALKKQWRQHCGIPYDCVEKTFDSFDRRLQRKVFEQVHKWATEFPMDAPRGYPSLIIYSLVNGLGKTHLAVASANLIIERWAEDPDWAICPVRMESGPGLVRRIRATYNAAPGQLHETEEDVYRNLKGVKLLILDDVGLEKPSRHTEEVYFYIVDERMKSGLPLIITSNKPLEGEDSLEDLMGKSTVSRLIGMSRGNYFKLTGKDWRKEHKVP